MVVIRKSCALWQTVLAVITMCTNECLADSVFANADKLIVSELAIINRKAPIEISDHVRFDKAYVNDRIVTYDFTLMSLVSNTDPEDYTLYASDSDFVLNRKQQICSAEHFKWYFKYGYSVEYRYLDASQKPVVGVTVDGNSC